MFQNIGVSGRLMALSFFLWVTGEGLWFYIQPLYPERLGATPEQVGLALAMFGVGRLLAIIPFSMALAHYNARTVMIPGYLLGIVGMVILVVAPTWEVAAVGFGFYGLSGPTLIAATVYMTAGIAAENQGHQIHIVMSRVWAISAIGTIVAPTIGGYLGEVASFQLVFALSAAWFTLSLIPIILWGQNYPSQQTHPFNPENLRLLLQPKFVGLNLLFLAALVVAPLGFALVPKWLEEVHHYSTSTLGVLGMLSGLGVMVWNLTLGQQGAWKGFLAAQILLMLGFISLVAWQALPAAVIAYVFYGAWFALRPFVVSLIARRILPTQQGFAFAIIDFLYGISWAVAPFGAGLLYAQEPSLPLWLAMIASSVIVVAVGAYLLWRNFAVESAYRTTQAVSLFDSGGGQK